MSLSPGSQVLVQWSDGNQYEAQVQQQQSGQVLISFPNGQQHWVGEQYVSPAAAPAPPAPPAAQPAVQQIGDLQVVGDALDIDGDIKVYDTAQDYMNDLQQVIQKVESQGIPLAGVDPAQPITFFQKQSAITKATMQGMDETAAVQQQGFSDREHYSLITEYIEAKWSFMGTDEDGQPEVKQHDDYANAMVQAQMQSMQQDQADAASADPSLLAPVGGVSVDQWAQASVALASLPAGATPQHSGEALAKLGLDQAGWDAANAGWQAKMQGDTTGAIAQKFGEAFAAAQGMAGGSGGAGTAEAGGASGEPCTFERYVEIMAAQGAWAEQGFDVNAKLTEVFGIDALEYSRLSSYWSPKMASDVALATQMSELDATYRQKYAGVDLDADLVL